MKLKGSSSNSGAKPGDSSVEEKKKKKKKKKKKDVPNSFNEKEIKLTAKDLPVFHVPALPRQNNYCDCGVFVLKYVMKLLLDLPHVTQQVLETKCKGAFGDNWFSLEDIAALRMQILEHFMGKEFSWQSATPQRKDALPPTHLPKR